MSATVITVRGPVPAREFVPALVHEHVLCDFAGADKTGPHRYDRREVIRVMLPHLQAARRRGIRGFVDCTPAYIGRDPELLRTLAEEADLHIVTNTGYYKEPYLPRHAFEESEEALAARWIREAREGIGTTGIRPGFIKIAVNPGPLLPVQQKIVRAAARTSRATGLAIACHTAHGPAALETIALLREERADLGRFIVVHSDAIEDHGYHVQIADAGAWVEYDAVGWKPIEFHVQLITWFLKHRGPDRLLVSHDAGWYWVGEPGGGKQKPFTVIHDELLPALRRAGVDATTLDRLLCENPIRAFALPG